MPRDALPQFGRLAAADPAQRRELWEWSALAILSLALAGLAALLLAVSRLPGIEDTFPWPLGFFAKGLVTHVVFSFVVWFLCVFGALLHLATLRLSAGRPRLGALGRIGVLATAAASVLLFAPALMDRGEASLNNYVPVIIDPLYYVGLVVLALGPALAVVRLLVNVPGHRGDMDPLSRAVVVAGMIYLVALACFALALWRLGDAAPSHAFNEDLFWGGGHVLQFVNTALLAGAWYALAGIAGFRPAAAPHTVAGGLLLLFALPAPYLYFAFDAFSGPQTQAFTNLQYALAVPILVAGAGVLSAGGERGARALPWTDPAFLCLALSVAVIGVGGMLGLFVDGADTRTPAHYHGMIGAVTVAFMGLFLRFFLPLLKRTAGSTRIVRAQVILYAAGQLLASIGLFWAGGFGAPRKTAGAAQGLEDAGAIAGMALNGVGALIAVIGGVLFIWTVGRALVRPPGGER